MIKIYCDKCGKEITGNVHAVEERIEAKDCQGAVITRFKGDTLHYCDQCQYEDLTCGFKVGDHVVTSSGQVGIITDICTCDQCKKRGFYEPKVEVTIGTGSIYITDNDRRVNFISFYRIGDHIYGNIDEDSVIDDIKSKKEEISDTQRELVELKQQLNTIKRLKG
jgi:hypothetical protein